MRDALGDVQSVLVLGGRSEIALATVQLMSAQRVQRVVLAVRDVASAAADAEALRSNGCAVDVVAFDATASAEVHAEFVRTVCEHTDIDLVILAFGIVGDQTVADDDVVHTLDILKTNFTGAVSVLVPVAERLARQGHGTIAVISSVAAMRPRRANFVYSASKAGLDAYASGLCDAYAGTGVHVMTVRPGFVHTRMTEGMKPAPFATNVGVVAEAIVDGIRRKRNIVYAPNILRFVMPILQNVPRVVWRKLGA